MRALGMFFRTSSGDLIGGRKLATADWLETVVYTSLFTNARAASDEVPAGEIDRGGYWGDAFSTRSHGSLLWTVRREKFTPEVLLRIRDICIRALAWLLDEKHLTAVDVLLTVLAPDRLGLQVICTPANTKPYVFNWEYSNAA